MVTLNRNDVTAAEDLPSDGAVSNGAEVSTALPHPEEMKASVDVRISSAVTISASARATPAGLVSAALLTCAALVPLVLLARHFRGR